MNRLREKTTATLLIAIFTISTMVLVIPAMAKKSGTTIQDGILTYSTGHFLAGQPLKVGYDVYGYNYQAHLFKGRYINVYVGRYGFPSYNGEGNAYLLANPVFATGSAVPNSWYETLWLNRDTTLIMKWNDAWLSNMDRNTDGDLDRFWGYPSYLDSGAWETNHMWGTYPDGTQWNYFVKIVAVPSSATDSDPINNNNGIWTASDGTVIGQEIWGQFAIIFQVSNDPSVPEHGVLYNPPSPTGFGYYK